MSPQPSGAFKYDLQSITQNAPPISGVFTLFSSGKCLFVGESDDICASLLQSFFEDNPSLNGHHPTYFIFEPVPPESRLARRADRIRELAPVCHPEVGSPARGHMVGPQAHPGVTAIPDVEPPDGERASQNSTSAGNGSAKDPDFSTAGQGCPIPPGPPGQASGVDDPPIEVGEKAPPLSSAQPITAPRPETLAAVEAEVSPAVELEPGRRETSGSGATSEHPSESTPVESAEATARSDLAQTAQIPATAQAGVGQTGQAVAKAPGAWARWKFAAISGLLLVLAGATLWMLFSRGVPVIARGPLPPQSPAGVQVPSVAAESGKEAVEPAPLPQGGTPTEIVSRETVPQETSETMLPPKTGGTPTAEPKTNRAGTHQGPAPRARSQREASARKTDAQSPTEMDPTAIIDWLLKGPSVGKE